MNRAPSHREVAGLFVSEWDGDGPTVLTLPGLTSAASSWAWLAGALPDVRLVAPDLRGRGQSVRAGGPPGLRAHAEDVINVAKELDLHDVVVVGHSMGAFLAPVVADGLSGRVARLVLVDGGVPPKLPPLMTRPTVRLLFTAGMRKAAGPWPDAESFAAVALGKSVKTRPDLRDELVAIAAAMLDGPAGELRPQLDPKLCVADAVDTFFGGAAERALRALSVDAHLLWCTSGKHDGARPMYTQAVVDRWMHQLPRVSARRVEANHVTVLFSPELVAAVAG